MRGQVEKVEPYIPYYIHQFGRIRFKGAGFLIQILRQYVMEPLPLDNADYMRLIAKAASEKGVTPEALKKSVKRYVEDGWEQGFSWEWQKYTGWSEDTPPDTNTAIQLLCESFFDFVKNYGALIQENRAYYLRDAIESRDENLKDILSSADDIIVESHLYMTLEDKKELDAYVCYLTYRVQRDLYELCQEGGKIGELSWQEFVWDIRHWKRLRFAAIIVLQETIKEFRRKGHFNFEAENVARFLDDSDMADRKDGNIYSSQLFPAEEGRAQVESILLTAEIVQYKRQLAMGKAYSWEYFLADMSQDQSLWNETLMAFRDALVNLDFKPLWQSEQLEELIKEMDPAE